MTELLAQHTTLRVGGPARDFVRCRTEADLVRVISELDAAGEPMLVLGGGSNLVVSDSGFAGTVVHADVRGIAVVEERDRVMVTAGCGEPWDDVVAFSVAQGWSGIEAMSGIPGSSGATPVQNVGAYGQEVAQTIANVRVFDRTRGEVRDLTPDECQFSYRSSVFKHEPHRFVVLAVTFALAADPWTIVRYAQLADALGVGIGETATSAEVRDEVIALRRAKGMVIDASDADSCSAGSFFTNPIVSADIAAGLPADCPRYIVDAGVKLSAAWLIEHAGVTRGWRAHPGAHARVSNKHTLAIVNAGGATAADVVALAHAIAAQVREHFGVELRPEPTFVGVDW